MKISKKAIGANWAYDHSKIDDINKAYKNPSIYKIRAFKDIWFEMHKLGGHDLRITGAGSQFFSCAYVLGDKLIYHPMRTAMSIRELHTTEPKTQALQNHVGLAKPI